MWLKVNREVGEKGREVEEGEKGREVEEGEKGREEEVGEKRGGVRRPESNKRKVSVWHYWLG